MTEQELFSPRESLDEMTLEVICRLANHDMDDVMIVFIEGGGVNFVNRDPLQSQKEFIKQCDKVQNDPDSIMSIIYLMIDDGEYDGKLICRYHFVDIRNEVFHKRGAAPTDWNPISKEEV